MAATAQLRLFPLNTVLFPGAVLNLHVFEKRYRRMIAECLDANEAFGVVLIREGKDAGDADVTPHDIGTTAEISEVTPLPAGRYYISTLGRRRFRIRRILNRDPYLLAEVEFIEDRALEDVDARANELTHRVLGEFREYVRLLVAFSGADADVDVPHDPVDASFIVGDALQVADTLKQRLLELRTAEARLAAELGFLRRLLPQLRALLERKQAQQEVVVRDDAPGGEFRAHQERFFGKHFSLN
jgi:Lon protease-like protein